MDLFEFFLNEIDPKFRGQIHTDTEKDRVALEKAADEAIEYVRDSQNIYSDEVIELLTGIADLDTDEIVKRSRKANDRFHEGTTDEIEDKVGEHGAGLADQVEAGKIDRSDAREETKRYRQQVKDEVDRRSFVAKEYLNTLVAMSGRVGFTSSRSKATDKYLYRQQSLGFGKGTATVNRQSGADRGAAKTGHGSRGVPADRWEAMKAAEAGTKTGDELAAAYERPEEISPTFRQDVADAAAERDRAREERIAAMKAAKEKERKSTPSKEMQTAEMARVLKQNYPNVLRAKMDEWEMDPSEDKPSKDQFIRDLYKDLVGDTTVATRAPSVKKPAGPGFVVKKKAAHEAIDRFLAEALSISDGEISQHWSDDLW
jgi:hypothetical protein